MAATALSAIAAVRPALVEAAFQPDMSYFSASTWTADPVAARVHVEVDLTATSHAENSFGHRSFYDTLEMTLPPVASGITASTPGRVLPVEVQGRNSSGRAISVQLGRRLYDGDTIAFRLRFDLVDAGGSTSRDLRIGRSVMSFPVQAFGSPGTRGSSVNVVFPSDFTVQEEFGSLTRSLFGDGDIRFSSGTLDDSTSFAAWFTGTQPVPESSLRTRVVQVGGLSVTLKYWPDDPGWATAVEDVLDRGMPLLRDMIGLGEPPIERLTVIEASSEEIGGYSGSYDPQTGRAQVSYLAVPFVILHEAAHLWFNAGLVSDRWIEEGFASYYAEQATLRLGLRDQSPQLSDRMLAAAIPFNDWVSEGVPNSATDAYLYAATLSVARQIASLAGPDGLAEVWRLAQQGVAAYQPEIGSPTELAPGALDWRRFLDLLETATSRSYESIWSQWVVSSSQRPLLAERLTTQNSYRQIVALAGSWDASPEIRRLMDGWQFEQADSVLQQARVVLGMRDRIASLTAAQGLQEPATLRTLFESSTVVAATGEATAELQTLDLLASAATAEASNRGQNAFLMGSDPANDLAAARRAFESGNLQLAGSLAQSAQVAWQKGYAAQVVRLAGIATGLVGLLMLLLVGLWSLRGRPGARPLAAAAGVSGTATPALPDAPSPSANGERTIRPGVAERLSGVASEGVRKRPLAAVPTLAMAGGQPDEASGGSGESSDSSGGGERPQESRRQGKSQAGGGGTRRHGQDAGDAKAGRGKDERPNGGTSDDLPTDPDADEGRAANPFGAGFSEPVDRDESAYDLLRRGMALLRDRHNAQAAVVLERAARAEPGKGSILEALGRAYFNSGQHLRAVETFEALLEVDPSAHYGHFGLGLSFDRLGRDQEARTHLRLAVALHPGSETYRRALERLEAKAD